MKKISYLVYNFINSGGWRVVIFLGVIGIVLCIIAIYGRCGFDIGRFIIADLPLFFFCGWSLYRVYKLIKNNKNIFR